jgi:hypothetical protein
MLRTLAPELLSGEDFNETTAVIELANEMNLTILHGGGPRPAIMMRSENPSFDRPPTCAHNGFVRRTL